jgi:hypothetical protein
MNKQQEREPLASGAKALMYHAASGGAEAPPFRAIIYEMTPC